MSSGGRPGLAVVVEAGDLAGAQSRDTLDATGLFLQAERTGFRRPGATAQRLIIGQPLTFTVTEDSAGNRPRHFIENGRARALTRDEAIPGGPMHAAVGCYAVALGEWSRANVNARFLAPPASVELKWLKALGPKMGGSLVAVLTDDSQPVPFRYLTWTVRDADSIDLVFSTGFAGFRMALDTHDSGLKGTASMFTDVMDGSPNPTASVTLTRQTCK